MDNFCPSLESYYFITINSLLDKRGFKQEEEGLSEKDFYQSSEYISTSQLEIKSELYLHQKRH